MSRRYLRKHLHSVVYECGCLVELEPMGWMVNSHCMKHREPFSHFNVVCRDCGLMTPINLKAHRSFRCPNCQKKRNRKLSNANGKNRRRRDYQTIDLDQTLREIAAKMGITFERVRQIEANALRRFMKHWIVLHFTPELEAMYPIDHLPFRVYQELINGVQMVSQQCDLSGELQTRPQDTYANLRSEVSRKRVLRSLS